MPAVSLDTIYPTDAYSGQFGGAYLVPTQEAVYAQQTKNYWLQPVDDSEFADTPIPGFNGLGQIPDLFPGVSAQTKSYVLYGSIAIVALSVLFWMSRKK
ncbi:MAG: hypothetical protein GZ088_09750 [Acidipila sp.]|nr:hypothetical protein [Acidipila sp.]